MKAIATGIFGIASAVGTCLAGAGIASYVVAEPEHGSLRNNLKPDLWTIEPTRVTQSNRHYERLPPALSTYAQQELQRGSFKASASVELQQTPLLRPAAIASTATSQHREWCSANYRSYDTVTDTYRSFSGEHRTCVSPTADASAMVVEMPLDRDRASWCADHYASYRISDNSYQPFKGRRLPCVPTGESGQQIADTM